MDNTCIIGYGMVGSAMAKVFNIGKHFDILPERSNCTLKEASKSHLIFVCLPTPVDRQGNYQLDQIKQIIRQINDFGQGNIFVIRSTVAPGFAMGLQIELGIDRIISNPEFLSEATAIEDEKNPPFIVVGGAEGRFRSEVIAFYQSRIKSANIIETDNTTAEMIKISLNSYFATKVIFANQLHDYCQLTKANYQTVKKVLESHPFGPKNHFTIWYKGKRGVNGHCLPKDSQAFANYSSSQLLKKVVELNENYIHQRGEE